MREPVELSPSGINEGAAAKLRGAVEAGDIELVKALVKSPDDANKKDGYGKPILNIAAEHGHLDLMAFLLENGAKPKNLRLLTSVCLCENPEKRTEIFKLVGNYYPAKRLCEYSLLAEQFHELSSSIEEKLSKVIPSHYPQALTDEHRRTFASALYVASKKIALLANRLKNPYLRWVLYTKLGFEKIKTFIAGTLDGIQSKADEDSRNLEEFETGLGSHIFFEIPEELDDEERRLFINYYSGNCEDWLSDLSKPCNLALWDKREALYNDIKEKTQKDHRKFCYDAEELLVALNRGDDSKTDELITRAINISIQRRIINLDNIWLQFHNLTATKIANSTPSEAKEILHKTVSIYLANEDLHDFYPTRMYKRICRALPEAMARVNMPPSASAWERWLFDIYRAISLLYPPFFNDQNHIFAWDVVKSCLNYEAIPLEHELHSALSLLCAVVEKTLNPDFVNKIQKLPPNFPEKNMHEEILVKTRRLKAKLLELKNISFLAVINLTSQIMQQNEALREENDQLKEEIRRLQEENEKISQNNQKLLASVKQDREEEAEEKNPSHDREGPRFSSNEAALLSTKKPKPSTNNEQDQQNQFGDICKSGNQ